VPGDPGAGPQDSRRGLGDREPSVNSTGLGVEKTGRNARRAGAILGLGGWVRRSQASGAGRGRRKGAGPQYGLAVGRAGDHAGAVEAAVRFSERRRGSTGRVLVAVQGRVGSGTRGISWPWHAVAHEGGTGFGSGWSQPPRAGRSARLRATLRRQRHWPGGGPFGIHRGRCTKTARFS